MASSVFLHQLSLLGCYFFVHNVFVHKHLMHVKILCNFVFDTHY